MKNTLIALIILLSLNVYAQEDFYDPKNEIRWNEKAVQITEPSKTFPAQMVAFGFMQRM